MLTVAAGSIMFPVGSYLLAVFTFQAWRDGRETFRVWARPDALVALLLCANFPAAVAGIAAAEPIMSTYRVTVHNAGTTRVDGFQLWWPGGSRALGPIAAGSSVSADCIVTADGMMTFQQTRGTRTTSGILRGYVCRNLGSPVTVTSSETRIDVDGRPAIDPSPNPATAPVTSR